MNEQPKRKWQFLKYGDDCIMMKDRCYTSDCNLCKQGDRFFAWKIPARTVNVCGTIVNFKEGCNLHRAKLLKDILKSQKSKSLPYRVSQFPILTRPVEVLRVGSHKALDGMRGGSRHYSFTDDYRTVFNDCLPGKDWVKKHYQDEYPEPTIEISYNGKPLISLNGNYKKGTIKQAVKAQLVKAQKSKGEVRLK